MRPRIAVVGGGITGAFAAYFLAKLGAEAIIIERGDVGGQASGNSVGGLHPLHGQGIPGPMSTFALESYRLHLDSWPEIRERSGSDFEGGPVSRLHVALDSADAELLSGVEERHNQTSGFSAQWLSPQELRRVEPRLARRALAGVWTEGNSRVEPGPYTEAVVAAALSLGSRVVRAEVVGLVAKDRVVAGVWLANGHLDCDGVVLAPGPWCEEPARWLHVTLPVGPVKGELLLADPPAGGFGVEITWREFGIYGAPGNLRWLGGTEERIGFDATPTREARARILDNLDRLAPGTRSWSVVRHVAGLRPLTSDGLPIVGIPDQWANACVALGGGRKGILLGAGLGMAAAELLTFGHTLMSIDAFHPGRTGLAA